MPEQLILCCSKFRMTDFSYLFFCFQIINRYHSVRYRNESRTLEMCLLYVKLNSKRYSLFLRIFQRLVYQPKPFLRKSSALVNITFHIPINFGIGLSSNTYVYTCPYLPFNENVSSDCLHLPKKKNAFSSDVEDIQTS